MSIQSRRKGDPPAGTPSSAVFLVGDEARFGRRRHAASGAGKGRRGVVLTSKDTGGAERTFERVGAVRLAARPLAILSLLNKDAVTFIAGGVAGAIGKTVTAPLDRVKLLLQTKGMGTGAVAKAAASGSLVKAFVAIGKEEGIMGYWRGNTPQVLRVLPYAALQLCTYDIYKGMLGNKDGTLSVPARLSAGALAGMTSTLMTYPLDTIRLRMAVDPSMTGMRHVVKSVVTKEGGKAMFKGLGGALMGIAPYLALELASYDVLKKSVPDHWKGPAANFCTGFAAAMVATSVCFPLDTVRRQMQMASATNGNLFTAMIQTVKADGVPSLYRGFVPNMLKNLPNKGIRLSTFDAAKALISAADSAYDEEAEAHAKETAASMAVGRATVRGASNSAHHASGPHVAYS